MATVVVRSMCFEMTFAGPPRERDKALRALADAGFDVAESRNPHADDGAEAAKCWLVAEQHDSSAGAGPHTGDDQQQLMDKATAAIGQYGYELRMHGVGRRSRLREV